MRQASQQVVNRKLESQPLQAVEDLKRVARAFDRLYELRQRADYDNSQKWSRTSAMRAVTLANTAFGAWQDIKTEEIAQDYLLQLLIQRR
jgi:hypothetical protein